MGTGVPSALVAAARTAAIEVKSTSDGGTMPVSRACAARGSQAYQRGEVVHPSSWKSAPSASGWV